MSKMNFYPCMIFDAVCYLQQRFFDNREYLLKDEFAFIEKMNALTDGKLDDKCLGMSNLCYILSTYTDNNNIQHCTLDDLAAIFSNPNDISKVVRAKITNDFLQSIMFPSLEWLTDGGAAMYVRHIAVLKEVGFDTLWKSELLPGVNEAIAGNVEYAKRFDIDTMFYHIQQMKNIAAISDCNVYVSFLSYPVAFSLYDNCFLSCIGSYVRVDLIAHELMHGFASKELTDEYLKFVSKNEFLAENHQKLIEYSGNEEEFCVAVGLYLGYLAKSETRESAMYNAKNTRNCPLSVIILDMLIKEETAPADYNAWLIRKFKDRAFPSDEEGADGIETYIASL